MVQVLYSAFPSTVVVQPRVDCRLQALWEPCRSQKQQGTGETLPGPAALTTRAKRVGEFNDKENAPKSCIG